MKQFWKYMIVALAGLSLLACNKEQTIEQEVLPEETPVVKEFTYTIAIDGNAGTKASLNGDHMAWQDGDHIGWFTDKAGNSEIDMDSDPRSFQVSSNAAMAAGAKVYAYAPYTTEGTVTAAPLSIPTAQDGVITNAMPMVSLPIELTDGMSANTDTPIMGQASFLGLGAVIEYNVYTSDDTFGAEKVQSVQFASSSNIAGDFTVDLTTVSEDAIPAPSGLNQSTVTSTLATASTVGADKDHGIKVYQVIAPGTWSGTITVTTDVATYTYTITDKAFSRGKIKTFNVNLASENAVRIDCPYWHTFANGDFGIGPRYDHGGEWGMDGYYYGYDVVNPYVLDRATWSLTDCGYYEWAGTQAESGWRHGIQLGTGGMIVSDFKLSSSSFPGTITSVTLGYNSGITDKESLSVSCKVGGNTFGSTVYHGDGDYEAVFSGNASGEIEITVASSEYGAIYLYYLYIVYEP